ncbi:helix-turn-helix transcriptional regulator [Paenibacillus polysaccharolyticus]|uniref:winged helix-turn-helix transcriptional regulator n=1 Tax=Paenibacillus polysaccharolyticus TaxID=582692 RepID=UPI00203F06B2|nr:helix-turn-helix domain-containing protein [Paenibacillus polysaccharolyticus]MCM3132667.1 helix-turn-helix transcriptional regulator [Paenibacillus polysaccharolyticus]
MTRICKDGFHEEFREKYPIIFGMAYTQHVLSGRWKFLIIWFLKNQARRFHEIKSFLNDIPQGSLTKQLRELEENRLISRHVFPEVPPRVEYSLSDKGRDLLPILDMMEKFGLKHGEITQIKEA